MRFSSKSRNITSLRYTWQRATAEELTLCVQHVGQLPRIDRILQRGVDEMLRCCRCLQSDLHLHSLATNLHKKPIVSALVLRLTCCTHTEHSRCSMKA